ncbi:MAG TPA: sugar ABC transporter ATP-binding protein, partial [Trebonia sp.]
AGRADRPALQITGLRKSFESVVALSDFTLSIAPGEIHALLGENGSGKSTLIKILSGYYQPDEGDVHVGGQQLAFGSPTAAYDLGCRFVHQDLGLVDSLSIADNLALGTGFPTRFGTVRDSTARALARSDLSKVGLDLDPGLMVEALPPAHKTGVAVARALRENPSVPARLLVLDEPTATLPVREVDHLLQMVRTAAANGVAVLYVSHRLDEILQLAHNVSVLRDGVRVVTRPVAGLDRKALVSAIVGTDLTEVSSTARAPRDLRPAAEPVLQVSGLYSDSLDDIGFTAAAGEIVGFAGITGSGRDLLLGTVFGLTPRQAGVVGVRDKEIPGHCPDQAIAGGLAYLPADRQLDGGMMGLTARENLTLVNLKPFWHRGLLSLRGERAEAATWFSQLQVRPRDGSERRLETFSGGNQQKILFAKWLRQTPPVLLLDEPTQGVDVGARAALHQLIISAAAGGMAVVISSSDADELEAVCHRVLIMRDRRIAAELSGTDATSSNISRECLGVAESDPTHEP